MSECRVVYARWLFWAYGMAVTPRLVLIRENRKDDLALLAHEAMHCGQMERDGTWRFWWRWCFNRAHRLHYEVEAYQVALTFKPEMLDRYAASLAMNYGLEIPIAQARQLLLATYPKEA